MIKVNGLVPRTKASCYGCIPGHKRQFRHGNVRPVVQLPPHIHLQQGYLLVVQFLPQLT